eukprot:2177212-Alexandrium_andersonii.AAC.1
MSASLVGSEMCIRDSFFSTRSSFRAFLRTLFATRKANAAIKGRCRAVSYTHLTLPTICSV